MADVSMDSLSIEYAKREPLEERGAVQGMSAGAGSADGPGGVAQKGVTRPSVYYVY